MKKLGLFTQLVPGLLVTAMAWAGFVNSAPVFSEIAWPEKPVIEETVRQDSSDALEQEEAKEAGVGQYEDGVHQGTGTGYGGQTKVEVTVENKQITKVEVLSHQDTPSFFQRVEGPVIKAILHEQTWEVDSVSGATYSSRGIKEAVCNALTGQTSASAVPEKKSPEKLTVSEYQVEAWKDGTFEGSAKGFGGTVKVKVTIQDGKITKIEVVSHGGETPSYYQKATGIINRILKAQDPNVDTVSGATYTSNGIREAVKAALTKAAGGKVEETETATPESSEQTTTQKPIVIPEGTPADGTYTGTTVCEQSPFFHYNVTVTASYKKGKLKKVTLDHDDHGKNSSYINTAWNYLKNAFAEDMTGDVDTVSGATYTSKAIKQAYRLAYAQAIEANGGTLEETKPEKTTEEETPATSEEETSEEGTSQEEAPVMGLADGTYQVSALVDSNAAKQSCQRGQFESYTLSGKVSFADGKLVSIDGLAVGLDAPDEEYEADEMYASVAADGVISSLLKKQNANVDVVSGATCSSFAIIQLYEEAKEKAMEAWQALLAAQETEQAKEETAGVEE